MANKDFFLDPDDAQTFGNIDYMRRSVRVRHTFPKTLKNPNGFAIEKEVSAVDGRSIDNLGINGSGTTNLSTTQSASNSNSISIEPIKTTAKKRPQGNSMDMFRNMARNIGKN